MVKNTVLVSLDGLIRHFMKGSTGMMKNTEMENFTIGRETLLRMGCGGIMSMWIEMVKGSRFKQKWIDNFLKLITDFYC
jgi:hypothetical protein